MKQRIMAYINKLESYKTAIKNLHWSSGNMSEHKLLDDIASSLSDYQDDLAETVQGIYGKIKINELRPRKYNITNSKKMINDLLNDTKMFLGSTRSKDMVGVKSIVEAFIGELNQFSYLMDFCLKEDIKIRIKQNLMNEELIRTSLNQAIKNVLK